MALPFSRSFYQRYFESLLACVIFFRLRLGEGDFISIRVSIREAVIQYRIWRRIL